MLPLRNAIDLETSTLEAKLQEIKLRQETMNDVVVPRVFLDGKRQTMNQYIWRGLPLDLYLDFYRTKYDL